MRATDSATQVGLVILDASGEKKVCAGLRISILVVVGLWFNAELYA